MQSSKQDLEVSALKKKKQTKPTTTTPSFCLNGTYGTWVWLFFLSNLKYKREKKYLGKLQSWEAEYCSSHSVSRSGSELAD